MDGVAAAMQAFFERNALPMWAFEVATLRVLAVNDAAVAAYGFSREEFLALTIAELHPDASRGALLPLPGAPGGSGVARGVRHRHRDGSQHEVDVAWCEVAWAGRAARLVLIVDAEAEHAARRSASHAEALLELASRVARVGAWHLDLATGAVELSAQARALLDLPPGAVPALGALGSFFAPEDELRLRELYARCLEEGLPFDCEVLAARRDGERRWVRILGESRRDPEGHAREVYGTIQDIDAQRRAELLAASASRDLAATLEHLRDAFITLDAAWRVTYANPEAERLLRRPRARLLGRVLWDEVAARGSELERELAAAKARGQETTFEVHHEPLGCWLEVRTWPAGELLAVHLADTSARHASSASLAHEPRFRQLASVLADAIWDWDLASGGLWWSDALSTHFGFTPGTLGTIDAWRARLHPADRERVLAGLARVIDGGGAHWLDEYRFAGPTGQWLTVVDRGTVVRNADGRATRLFGALTDVTRRRETEEQLRQQATLLDHAQDAIVVRDLEHRVRYWNRAAERRYGWSRAEALGQDVRTLVYADADRPAFDAATEAVRERGEWAGELTQHTRDGKALAVETRWTLLRDEQGTPSAVLTINTDVTEKKGLERQFLRAQRLESLGTLAGGIAHDLNNVLAPILMTASSLQADEADPERLEELRDIHRAAQRGADIVKQLLTFARGTESRQAPVDLRRIARELRQMAQETFPKDIKLVLELPAEPCTIEGDATQLHQVLTNLCVNARDAMPHGGTLSISLGRVVLDEVYAEMNRDARPGRWVLLRVEDTGTGMPPGVLEHLFEPFFTTKDPGRGTGLGLSTVQAIVRRHRGFVRVETEEGRGTRFLVYLPEGELSAERGFEASSPTPLPRGEGQLVLVVDDEAPIRAVARRTLERFGYRTLLAANGAEAVALYAQHRDEVAVVLTDLTMPVMDGAATIVALRSLNPRVPIVASSGDAMAAPGARLAELGTPHFVPKPYTAETLLRALREALAAAP